MSCLLYTSAELVGDDGANKDGWHNQKVDFTLNVSDATSGIKMCIRDRTCTQPKHPSRRMNILYWKNRDTKSKDKNFPFTFGFKA